MTLSRSQGMPFTMYLLQEAVSFEQSGSNCNAHAWHSVARTNSGGEGSRSRRSSFFSGLTRSMCAPASASNRMRCTFPTRDVTHCCMRICWHSPQEKCCSQMLPSKPCCLLPNVARFSSKRHLLEADAASSQMAHHGGAPSTLAHPCTICSGFGLLAGLCADHRGNVKSQFSDVALRLCTQIHLITVLLARSASVTATPAYSAAPADRSWRPVLEKRVRPINPLAQVSSMRRRSVWRSGVRRR